MGSASSRSSAAHRELLLPAHRAAHRRTASSCLVLPHASVHSIARILLVFSKWRSLGWFRSISSQHFSCSVLFSSLSRCIGTWKVRLVADTLAMIELEHHLSTVAWNVGCVVYIFWIGGECLINFINMMIWRDNAINVAPVWCDISEYCSTSCGDVSTVADRYLPSEPFCHRLWPWCLLRVPRHQPPPLPHRQRLRSVDLSRGQTA